MWVIYLSQKTIRNLIFYKLLSKNSLYYLRLISFSASFLFNLKASQSLMWKYRSKLDTTLPSDVEIYYSCHYLPAGASLQINWCQSEYITWYRTLKLDSLRGNIQIFHPSSKLYFDIDPPQVLELLKLRSISYYWQEENSINNFFISFLYTSFTVLKYQQ